MLVVNNQTFATNVVQVITRVWNQVLEPDNLHYWQREIDFSEKTKSSDQSEFKLWLLGQNLVDNWLLTLQPHMLICTHKMAACGVESSRTGCEIPEEVFTILSSLNVCKFTKPV